MKKLNRFNHTVSLYRNSRDTIGVEVNMLSVLMAIKEGRWKELIDDVAKVKKEKDKKSYSEAKQALPAVTFSGTFSQRGTDFLKRYSGFMVIDIDEKLKKWQLSSFDKCPYTAVVFKSPSGVGYKILFELSSHPKDHKEVAFEAVEYYFKRSFGIKIDKSGKNIDRLCYISYDPDLIVKEEYMMFDVRKWLSEYEKSKPPIEPPKPRKSGDQIFDVYKIYDVAKKITTKHFQFVKGQRNNYIHYLSCVLNRAGVSEQDALNLMLMNYPSLSKEIPTTVNSAYKHNKSDHGSYPITGVKSNNTSLFDETI